MQAEVGVSRCEPLHIGGANSGAYCGARELYLFSWDKPWWKIMFKREGKEWLLFRGFLF